MARLDKSRTRAIILDAVVTERNGGNLGVTISEIAEKTGFNYYTVRDHFQSLIESQELEETGLARNRHVLFGIPDRSKTPRFHYNGLAQEKASMLAAFHSFSAGMIPSLMRVYKNLPLVHAALYQQAARVSAEAKVSSRELNEHRKGLVVLKEVLENSLQLVNEMLNAKQLWEPHSLYEVLLNDPTNPISVQEAISMSTDIEEIWGGDTIKISEPSQTTPAVASSQDN